MKQKIIQLLQKKKKDGKNWFSNKHQLLNRKFWILNEECKRNKDKITGIKNICKTGC